MLSGALLNGAMLGIVRYLAIADAAGVGPFARNVLVALGVVSLLIGALFIVRQDGIKRLMAYSSVEHMGVVALGFGFGGMFGIAGALYHMLNHSLNKSLMFFGAGNVDAEFRHQGNQPDSRRLERVPRAGIALARRGRRDHRSSALWPVPERTGHFARWHRGEVRMGRCRHAGAADRDLRRLPQSFSRNVFFVSPGQPQSQTRSQRMVRRADVVGARAAPPLRSLVALRMWQHFSAIAARSRGRRAMNAGPANSAAASSIAPDRHAGLRDTDGRMQMVYAWYPEPDRIELRYVATEATQNGLRSGAAYRAGPFPASPRFGP